MNNPSVQKDLAKENNSLSCPVSVGKSKMGLILEK